MHTPYLNLAGVFLDISKAFDKVWHERLISKLKSMEISDTLLDVSKSFWKIYIRFTFILGPLFFLIYINDLSNDKVSTVKLFADGTSLFSIFHDCKTSTYKLNKDFQKISEWECQWKMSFDSDLNKQAQEVIFSRKRDKLSHQLIYFSNAHISRVSF